MTTSDAHHLQDLITLIDGVVWEADPKALTNTFVSDKIYDMFGYTPHEWLSHPGVWEEHLHPQDREWVVREGEARMRAGVPYQLEYRMLTKTGRVVWIRDVITPIIENGELVRLGGVMLDITERKLTEQHVETLEQRFQGVFDGSPVAIGIGSVSQRRLVEVNQAWLDMLGYTRDEVLGRSGAELNLWVDQNDRVLLQQQLDAAGRVREFEYRMRAKDGREVHVLASVERIEFGGEPCLLYMTHDISRRKYVEANLRTLQSRFEKVFRASPVGIVVTSLHEGRIIDVNDTFLTLVGYDRADVVEYSVSQLHLWEDFTLRDTAVERVQQGVSVRDLPARIRRRDGTMLDMLISFELLELEGEPCLLSMMQDVTDRKRAEAALERSEARFRSLVQNSGDMIAVQTRKGVLTYMTPSIVTVLGVTPDEIIGQNGLESIHPDDHENVLQAYAAVVYGGPGATVRRTSRFHCKNGEWRWLEWVATNHLDDPNVQGIVLNSRDVTDRKAAEEALERSEARFRSLVQNSSDIITVLDEKGVIRYESPSVETILGHTAEDLVGQDALAYVHPSDTEIAMRAFSRVRKGAPGTSSRSTYRFRTRSGEWRWLDSISVNRTHDPSVNGIVMNSRDVTDQKEAEQELKHLQERFATVFLTSPFGITVLTLRDGRLIDANDAFLGIIGREIRDIVGLDEDRQPLWISAEDRAYVRRALEAGGSLHEYETKLIHATGETRDVLLSCEPIELSGERCALLFTQDVTARREAEAALATSQERLLASEKLASLGRLTAGLAHEINTPLAAGMNYLHEARRLADEYAASIGHADVTDADHREIAAELRAALDEAAKTTGRIGEFIRQMRGHTRDSASGVQDFNAARLTQDTLAMLAHQARAANVRLDFTGNTDVILRGEPGRFTQVVTNLVVNAIHACDEGQGSRVDVRVERDSAGARLIVTDDGSGISPDVLPRIFDPLFTTKQVGKGTGLGLSIIHDIVAGHFKGDIRVSTAVTEGTTFTVLFP